MTRALTAACLTGLLAALAAAACQGPGAGELEGQWVTQELDAPSERVLWARINHVLEDREFPRGAGINPATLVAQSGWRTRLHPFKGKGHRSRAEIHVEPLGDRRFEVRVRVESERNESLVNPADLRYAEWVPMADDVEEARILLQLVRISFEPEFEVGPREAKLPGYTGDE